MRGRNMILEPQKIDINKLTKDMTIGISISGMARFRFRLWLATQLMKLAARICGFQFQVIGRPADHVSI